LDEESQSLARRGEERCPYNFQFDGIPRSAYVAEFGWDELAFHTVLDSPRAKPAELKAPAHRIALTPRDVLTLSDEESNGDFNLR
jgi:hypothetical protein